MPATRMAGRLDRRDFLARGPVEATINGARYQIDLYRSEDGQSLRTTFPRFLGLA
jgi:hypothetical protein